MCRNHSISAYSCITFSKIQIKNFKVRPEQYSRAADRPKWPPGEAARPNQPLEATCRQRDLWEHDSTSGMIGILALILPWGATIWTFDTQAPGEGTTGEINPTTPIGGKDRKTKCKNILQRATQQHQNLVTVEQQDLKHQHRWIKEVGKKEEKTKKWNRGNK